MTDPTPPLPDVAQVRSRLRADLVAAMKARRPEDVSALRTAIAAIDNAEAVSSPGPAADQAEGPIAGASIGVGSTDVQRRTLDLDDIHELLQAQVDERLADAENYEQLGRTDAAERLRREATVLQDHLPHPESSGPE